MNILSFQYEKTYTLNDSSITFYYQNDQEGKVFKISVEGDNIDNGIDAQATFNDFEEFEELFKDFKNDIKKLNIKIE